MATYSVGKVVENGFEREVRYSIEEHENSTDCPGSPVRRCDERKAFAGIEPREGDMCLVIGVDDEYRGTLYVAYKALWVKMCP